MSPFWIGTLLVIAFGSMFTLAAYWYPRLEVTEDSVIVRNPLRTITVARETVAGVRTSGRRYPVLVTTTSEVELHCIEQSLAMRLRRHPHRIAEELHEVLPWRTTVVSTPVVKTWRRPTAFESTVGFLWFVMLLIAISRLP
jgi:hypothetical protein